MFSPSSRIMVVCMRMSPFCSRIFVKANSLPLLMIQLRRLIKGMAGSRSASAGRLTTRPFSPICAAPWTGLLCIASSGYARNAFKTTIAALSTATSSPLCLVRPNSYSVPFALTGRSKMAVTGCLTSLSERMSPACAKAIVRITSLSFAVSLSIFSNRIKRPSSASKTRDSRPPGITTISSSCFHSYSESSRLPCKPPRTALTQLDPSLYNAPVTTSTEPPAKTTP